MNVLWWSDERKIEGKEGEAKVDFALVGCTFFFLFLF